MEHEHEVAKRFTAALSWARRYEPAAAKRAARVMPERLFLAAIKPTDRLMRESETEQTFTKSSG